VRCACVLSAWLGASVSALGCGAGRTPQEPTLQSADERAIANLPVVEPVEPAPEPELTPIVVAPATAAHAAVQAKAVGGPLPDQPIVKFMPIEDATGDALASFHGALRKLAAGEDADGKVRVAVYGSSSVAADRYTGYLRGYLQQRFGDGGIGYVAAVPLWRWHRHNEVAVTATKGWSVEHGQKKVIREGGHLGLMGASAIASRKRVGSTIGPALREWYSPFAETSLVELHYLRQPGGGRFEVAIGSGKPTTVVTRAKQVELGVVTPKVGDHLEPIAIKLRGDGEVRLFGAVLERDEPGVVVDALGVGGTRAANMLVWDVPMWTQAIQARAPDLVVLAYGANECMDEAEAIDTYRANLSTVLARMKETVPQASCLLVGPVDFHSEDELTKAWTVRARLAPIIDTQRALAVEYGCGFFDMQKWMGGQGSMDAWVTAELAKADHLHFSKLGYLYLGRTLADALMYGYDSSEQPKVASSN
jgi:lysophospholipase L1-like esterase